MKGKQITTQDFIERARAVHGNYYDYSKSEYISAKTKLVISCPEHGDFEQTPDSHLRGSGCNSCGYKKVALKNFKSNDLFIKQAISVHGNRYDYSETYYKGAKQQVTVVCKKHGPFKVYPNNFLYGANCPRCNGMQIFSTEDFITLAKEVHGEKYEYSKAKYVDAMTKIKIICPTHGIFLQTAQNHIYKKAGCAACAGNARLTKEKFILRSEVSHKEVYDYSLVPSEINAKMKVPILCQEHGVFAQSVDVHQRGGRCPVCTNLAKFQTNEEIRERLLELHGDRKYDFSKTKRIKIPNGKDRITLKCSIHGDVETFLESALSGKRNPCPDCGYGRTTPEDFVKRAKKVHGDKYDYSKVDISSTTQRTTIICPVHGPFEQQGTVHLAGMGCTACGIEKRSNMLRMSPHEFLQKAIETHANRYKYPKLSDNYINSVTKIEIICPEHGSFWQTPGSHLSGSGCSACAKTGFDDEAQAILYYLRIATDTGIPVYKIGITNRSVFERFNYPDDQARIKILKVWEYKHGSTARLRESEILKDYIDYRYSGPPILSSGNTEIFSQDILGLDGA